MGIAAKVYQFTIPAGGAYPLQSVGTVVKVISCSGAFRLIGDTFGDVGAIQAGQGIRADSKEPPFGRLTFVDTSGAANNLSVLVADDQFIDDRVTGEVSVIDGNLARVRSNLAFAAAGNMTTTVGANSAAVQLFNVSTDADLVIERLFCSSNVAGDGWALRVTGTQLAGGGLAPFSKNAGGADSTRALIKTAEAALGAIPGKQLIFPTATTVGATSNVTIDFKTNPIVLPPGFGLTVADAYAAGVHSSVVGFEHYEYVRP